MEEANATCKEEEQCMRNFAWQAWMKKSLERPRRKWKDIIKADCKEKNCGKQYKLIWFKADCFKIPSYWKKRGIFG
jgi:hypothetical protein